MVSDAQKANVKESWGKAKAVWNNDGVGNAFFDSLFHAHEDVWQKFTGYFKTSDKSGVKGSAEMKKQAQAFGDLVSKWVDNLDNPDVKAFSASHKARGISADQVKRAFVHLAGFMKNYGGDEAAWGAVAEALLSKMDL